MSEAMRHRGYFKDNTSLSRKQNSSRRAARNRCLRSGTFSTPGKSEFSPFEFLKHLADRVAKAVRAVSVRRRHLSHDSSSLGRSYGASVDYHRTAAVEDCIEFIHTSFSRSNSSTITSRQNSEQTLGASLKHALDSLE